MSKKVKTSGKCVVCQGGIVEGIVQEYDTRLGPIVIGPGSANQLRERSDGFHCETCGLRYAFLPPANVG